MSQNSQLATFTKPGDLMQFLEKGKASIALALPKHLNPDRMLRLAVTCFSNTPKLRECTGMSILSSIVVASQLGLEPGIAGQGYLIPYKGTCTFVPGWQGMVSLLNNSGRATAWTGAVFEGDEFDFELGSRPRLRHIPNGEHSGDPDKLIWAYACGQVVGSDQPVIEAWPIHRIRRHRDKFNKVGNAHYSYTHPEMYARKVVLLQVLKYMPRSIELNNAIVAADAAERGNTSKVDGGIVIDVEPAARVEAPPTVKREPVAQQQAQEKPDEKPTERQEASAPSAQVEPSPEEQRTATTEPEAVPGIANPQEIPTDPGELLAFCRHRVMECELDEKDTVAYMKTQSHAGKACRTLADVASKDLNWLAVNLDQIKDAIAAS